MKQKKFYILMLCALLLACNAERRKRAVKKPDNHQAFIINFQHYFSDAEYNMSFPIWFNDSLIRKNNIKKITRSVYMSSKELERDLDSPKEVKTYHFNKDGQITAVEIEHYYENVKVGKLRFEYNGKKDENGFEGVKNMIVNKVNADQSVDHYSLYEKEKYGDKYLVYRNETTGDYLFFMLNKENWGPLTVDSILAPMPNDIVVLGNPMKPEKKYQVENMVNEINVVDFGYDKSRNYVKDISFDEYPFHFKRSIQYNKQGQCTGFIDSTFSDDKYITRRKSTFEISADTLPVMLKHEKKSGDVEESYYQYERLKYEFFDVP